MGFKNILDIVYSSAIFLTSTVTKNSDLWLFGAQGGYSYSDNSKYFFEWILDNRQEENCFWITKDKNIYTDLLSKGIPALYFYDIRNILSIARAKYIVCTHSHTGNDVYKFINRKKVLITLWHGIPLKRMGRAPKRNFLNYIHIKNIPDLFLTTSDRDAELFSDLYHINRKRFFIGTYPRVNHLILKAKDRKIVLYAPTFRDNMTQEYYDKNIFPTSHELENLNKVLAEFGYHFLVKMHPYVQAYFPNLDDFSNIDIIPAFEDVQNALSKAAILITDYSSIYFDYLNLDREIIFYTPDYEWYCQEYNRGLLYKYEDVTPGKKVTNWSELQSTLTEVLQDSAKNDFSVKRKEILDFFYSRRELDNMDLFSKCKEII